ncbi:ABC transporter ATP-binding protein [Alkalihalobacillus sp. LMS39]|uniref:ABC transporter ATP-binding protein n=1 Tax=Alkalihalobacillus sp. LMS39 TaxID=2924032 RepID=UPI001FB44050|nr:ABC transporter ATP-binding protein [Alkalihalobacillus sp. LMS39]UOE95789.1 ABC transporter ATP-binding protein [Alkalihalobacillus sp. LMS39]
MEYIVKTKRLSKTFGKEKAVNEVSMNIKKGEIYGFLGPNGAGKTTTIRMLLGLMKPTAGEVELFNQNLKRDKIEILRKIGSLVENPSYYPHLTAYENLEAIRKIVNVPKTRIMKVLDIVRLTDVATKKVKGFSLGMKQRLGIAAALLHEPELLILDEPTNGLDPSGIIEMRNLIKRLPEDYGMTVLISSHLLTEIDQMATTVGILSKGHLIFEDSIDKLRSRSQKKLVFTTSESRKGWRFLKTKGIEAECRGNQIYIEDVSNDDIAQIVKWFVADNISIYRIEEEKRSLEDIFLEITKEGMLDAHKIDVG